MKDTSNIPEEKTKKKVKNTREVDYVVKRGDTLYDIAKKYNTRIDEIVELNNIKDRDNEQLEYALLNNGEFRGE